MRMLRFHISTFQSRRRQYEGLLGGLVTISIICFVVPQLFFHRSMYLRRRVQSDKSQVISALSDHIQQQHGWTFEKRTRVGKPSAPTSAPVTCALCFFGLPRSFDTLVLPSIVEYILRPNAKHGCDIFMHYFDVTTEPTGRWSSGGHIDPQAVFKLKEEVHQVHRGLHNIPQVIFVKDTNETFWEKRGDDMDRYLNERNADDQYKYFPYKAVSWTWPSSLSNMVKQWHSVDAVWGAMESFAAANGKTYTNVAMLRNDVVYTTPIDVLSESKALSKTTQGRLTVPAFAGFPVNDRMAYGPYEAVKIWATERFSRVEDHASNPPRDQIGFVMHSERFMDSVIFKAIEEKGYEVFQDDEVCFYRARADGSVFLSDCDVQYSDYDLLTLELKRIHLQSITHTDCGIVSHNEDYVQITKCKTSDS